MIEKTNTQCSNDSFSFDHNNIEIHCNLLFQGINSACESLPERSLAQTKLHKHFGTLVQLSSREHASEPIRTTVVDTPYVSYIYYA